MVADLVRTGSVIHSFYNTIYGGSCGGRDGMALAIVSGCILLQMLYMTNTHSVSPAHPFYDNDTTPEIIQAISLAGGWNVGSNLRQVVIFPRDDSWRLVAAMVNLQPALYGRQVCPPGEIWLSDSDVVIVPKGKILVLDEFIDLVFTRGIYGVFPFSSSLNFSTLSRL